jgi:CubicO group peptidase (beta-lactamase class C family)
MLYEEGRFQLNDPVSRYIPEFKDTQVYVEGEGTGLVLADQERPISIRHLLTHTSGLCGPWTLASALSPLFQEAKLDDPHNTNQDFVGKLANFVLCCDPGSSPCKMLGLASYR